MEELNYADSDKKFNFEDFLATERDKMQWQSEGLSMDLLSIQNAIIIREVKRRKSILQMFHKIIYF